MYNVLNTTLSSKQKSFSLAFVFITNCEIGDKRYAGCRMGDFLACILQRRVGHKTDRKDMYYCENCAGVFEKVYLAYSPLDEHGGETVGLCPLCHAPDMMEKIEITERNLTDDKQRV